MKIKTADLTGPALDHAVAVALGWVDFPTDSGGGDRFWFMDPETAPFGATVGKEDFRPSSDRDQGYEIVEREGINLRAIRKPDHGLHGQWLAAYDHGNTGTMVHWVKRESWSRHYLSGPTPLIAAMRAFVTSKLGAEVEIPKELL